MGRGREWKECRGGPAEEKCDGLGEEGADPAEVSLYVAVAAKLGVGFGRARAREKDPKQADYDAPNPRRGRRHGWLLVPVPARSL